MTEKEWAELQIRMKGGDAPRPKPLTTGRDKAPVKNTTGTYKNHWEHEYALLLETRKQAREIIWWGYEPIRLKLADRTTYLPDFAVWGGETGRLKFIEIKGFLRESANVKFKVAAQLYPFAEFLMYRKKPAKEGGGWELIKHLNGGA